MNFIDDHPEQTNHFYYLFKSYLAEVPNYNGIFECVSPLIWVAVYYCSLYLLRKVFRVDRAKLPFCCCYHAGEYFRRHSYIDFEQSLSVYQVVLHFEFTSFVVKLTFNGKVICLSDWVDHFGSIHFVGYWPNEKNFGEIQLGLVGSPIYISEFPIHYQIGHT